MGDKFDDIIRQKLDDFKDSGEPNPAAMNDMFGRIGPIGPKAIAMAWLKTNALSLILATSVAGNVLFWNFYNTQESKISKLETQIEQLQSQFDENLVQEVIPQETLIDPVEETSKEDLSPAVSRTTPSSAPQQAPIVKRNIQISKAPHLTEETIVSTADEPVIANDNLPIVSELAQVPTNKHPIHINKELEANPKRTDKKDSKTLVAKETTESTRDQSDLAEQLELEEVEISRSDLRTIKKEEKEVQKELKKYQMSLLTSKDEIEEAKSNQTPEIIDPVTKLNKWRFGLVTARSQTKKSGFDTKAAMRLGLRVEYNINPSLRLSTGLERMAFTYSVDINKAAYRKGNYDKLPFNTSNPARIYSVTNKCWNVPIQLKYVLPEGKNKFAPFAAVGINNQLVSRKEFTRRIITPNNFEKETVKALNNEVLLANLIVEAGIEVPINTFDVQLSAFYERDLKARKPEGFKFNTYGIKLAFLLGK